MKLLLTSGGLRNPAITDAMLDLVEKPADALNIAFIPTAMNVETGDKRWAIDHMLRLRDLGCKMLDIVEIAAVSKEIWLPRLQAADVLFVNGGHTVYLMQKMNKSGLAEELPKLLEDRVYVGVSAGSHVASPDLRFKSDDPGKFMKALHLVDFGVQVHMNSSDLPFDKSEEALRRRIQEVAPPYPVYGLDDEMAVKVDGENVSVVGEGEYILVEP
jgi:dipeptidase E